MKALLIALFFLVGFYFSNSKFISKRATKEELIKRATDLRNRAMIDVQRLRNLNKTQSANMIELEGKKIAILLKDIEAAKNETDAIKKEEEKLDEAEKRLEEHLKKIESGYRLKRKDKWEAIGVEEPQEYETTPTVGMKAQKILGY